MSPRTIPCSFCSHHTRRGFRAAKVRPGINIIIETNPHLGKVIDAAKRRCAINLRDIHGVGHWRRVRENGLRLAKKTGADRGVVELFAFLHDCCREDDGSDLEHGPRAAAFIKTLRGTILELNDDDFETLRVAIHDHTIGHRHSNITVATCWDADRLDIGRIGARPHPDYLLTKAAKDEKMIDWAYQRSRVARW